MKARVTELLPPMWETCVEFLAPDFGLSPVPAITGI